MNKINFKVHELLELEFELNGGISDDGTMEYEGFLNQLLPIALKYELQPLSEFLSILVDDVREQKQNLILKYGEKDNEGNVSIKRNMDSFSDFEKEYEELMVKDVEISFPNILLSDVKEMGRTKDNYKVLFHLVKSN
jgi:hypothetical protein